MGFRDIFPTISGGRSRVHHECRECGRNLPASADRCPACDGEAVQYEIR